jgi:hypothetical protein
VKCLRRGDKIGKRAAYIDANGKRHRVPGLLFERLGGKKRVFIRLIFPRIGVGWRRFFPGYVGPQRGVLRVKFDVFIRRVRVRHDRVHWALWLAHTAINALIRVDDEHVFAFVKTINGAHIHAIGVFTFNAVFVYDICHVSDA